MTADWKMTASQFQNSFWCRTKGNISQSSVFFPFLFSSEMAFHEWHIWWQLNLDQALPPSSAALSLSVLEPNSGVFPIPYPCRCFHPVFLQHLTGSIHKPTRSTCFPPRRHLFFTPRYLLKHRGGAFSCRRLVFAYSETDVNLASALSVRLVDYSAFPLDAPEFSLRDTKYKLDLVVNNWGPFMIFGNRLDNPRGRNSSVGTATGYG